MADFTERRLRQRQEELLLEWRSIQDDVARWNRMHPDEEPIVIEPITAAEIEAIRNV